MIAKYRAFLPERKILFEKEEIEIGFYGTFKMARVVFGSEHEGFFV